jgi:hypothetical protein
MVFISFIYKIRNNEKTCYGKYVTDSISDDHEGLDKEVEYSLLRGINKYLSNNSMAPLDKNDIKIGIMSYSSDRYVPVYSTEKEIQCFDFYWEDFKSKHKIYVNGSLLIEK